MNKIVHLRASNFYGGPERQIHFHALLSQSSDYPVTIASYSEREMPPELLLRASKDNIPTHLFEVSSAYDRRAVSMIRSWLLDNNIKILCTHDYRSNILGWAATRPLKTHWLPFSRGKTSENLKVRLFHGFDSQVMKRAKNIVAVSGGEAQRLENKGIDSARISVVHNAANVGAFTIVEKVNLRERFHLPNNSIICLSAGRFSTEKGQHILIKAATKAIDQDSRLRFLLYGDGPDFSSASQEVEKLNLKDKILLPGFEQNLIGCMKDADMVINPSLSEGLPNVVLEAMAVETPVIATSVGGVPELISNNINGLLVPPDSPSVLSTAILELSQNSDLSEKLRSEALKTVKNDFSFEAQYVKLSNLYRQVIHND